MTQKKQRIALGVGVVIFGATASALAALIGEIITRSLR